MKICCYLVVWIYDFKDVYMYVFFWNLFVCRGLNYLRYIYVYFLNDLFCIFYN